MADAAKGFLSKIAHNPNRDQGSGGDFDGERIPFLKANQIPNGSKNEIYFLSDYSEEVNDDVPEINFYKSYGYRNQNGKWTEVVYEKGDEVDPGFYDYTSREGEEEEPKPTKRGYAFIFHLTAYNAVQKRKNKKRLSKTEKFYADLFGGQENFDGLFIWNFSSTVVNGIGDYIYYELYEEENPNPSLREYVFEIIKDSGGKGFVVEPGVDFQSLPDEIQNHINSLVQRDFVPLEVFTKNKRYTPSTNGHEPEELPEEFKVSTLKQEGETLSEEDLTFPAAAR